MKHNPSELNHLKWAAWGVIDIENLGPDKSSNRIRRRNYINRVRAELEHHGLSLTCGGSGTRLWYGILKNGEPQHNVGGMPGAFQRVCKYALDMLEPGAHSSGTRDL